MANFKTNVHNFYSWFKDNEEKIRKLLDQGKMEKAVDLINPEMKKVLGDLLFQIHKDQKHHRYLLELTTFTDDSKKVIGFYFCDELPLELKNKWSFYYYHPALKGTIQFQNRAFSADDFTIVPILNKKNKKIDIRVINKGDFKHIQEQDKFFLIYMMLADYVGEIVVDAYIGSISFGKPSLFKKKSGEEAVELSQLYDYIVNTVTLNKWIRPSEIKLIANYFKTKGNKKTVQERQDFVDGISYCVDLLNEEGTKDRALTDYIKSLGIKMYSVVTTKALNEEKDTAVKNEIERRLTSILSESHAGYLIHSIQGRAHNYADFFAYDEAVVELIQKEVVDSFQGAQLLEI